MFPKPKRRREASRPKRRLNPLLEQMPARTVPQPVNLPEAGQIVTFWRKAERYRRARSPLFMTIEAKRQDNF